jgi:peptidoglycan/xylan/chitin deacetylase (PgdA/CDA1 family)
LVPAPVVLTFDDGFQDFYTAAFPVLQQHGFSATMYLPTAFIGETRRVFSPTSVPRPVVHSRSCLTWSEVRELHAGGLEFGSHTVTHAKLVELAWAQINSEISDSKCMIEQKLGNLVTAFCYPYAFPQADQCFTMKLRQSLRDAGYAACVTTEVGQAKVGDDPLRLKRLPMNSCDDNHMSQAKLEGAYDWVGLPQRFVKHARRAMRRKELKTIRAFSSLSALASLLSVVGLAMVNCKLLAQCPSDVDPLASLAARFRVLSSTSRPYFELQGVTGTVYQVAASPNLVHWQNVGQIEGSGLITRDFDVAMTNPGPRFYRNWAVTWPHYALKQSTEAMLEDFEQLSAWDITGATKIEDANLFVSGTKSMQLSATGTVVKAQKRIDLDFSLVKSISVWVHLTGDSPNRLEIWFSSSNSPGTIYKTIRYPPPGRWLPIVANPDSFTEYNHESRTNRMVWAGLRMEYDVNATGVINWDALTYKKGGRARPKVALTFDDGEKSVYQNAFPIMSQHNIAGTCFIIKKAVGGTSYMSLEQLRTLYDAGWDISNHTANHVMLDQVTQSEAEAEIQGCSDFIEASGFTRNCMSRFLAYPQGQYKRSPSAIAAATACGILAARTTDNGMGVVCHDYEPRLELPGFVLAFPTSVDIAKAYVDRVIGAQGVGVIYFHGIGDTATSYYWPTESFRELCDYLSSRANEIDVVPMSAWYLGLPRSSGGPPP